MARQAWVKLPTQWIIRCGLKSLTWRSGHGADDIAALMVLSVLAHHADQELGKCSVTYDALSEATGLSRSKISNGLSVLKVMDVVDRLPNRSEYQLNNFDPLRGWGKFPLKRMYVGYQIAAFREFYLRRMTELDALKLFFLFVAFRNKETNLAKVSFDKIEYYTGVARGRIKSAQSMLAASGLIYVEHTASSVNDYGVANAYRIAGIEPYNHRGTRGRIE